MNKRFEKHGQNYEKQTVFDGVSVPEPKPGNVKFEALQSCGMGVGAGVTLYTTAGCEYTVFFTDIANAKNLEKANIIKIKSII